MDPRATCILLTCLKSKLHFLKKAEFLERSCCLNFLPLLFMQSMDPSTINEISSYLSQHLDTIPFKTLQRGELEASAEQKLSKMQDLLQRDPGLFLSRWGRFLPADILCKFEPLRGNASLLQEYELQCFLNWHA